VWFLLFLLSFDVCTLPYLPFDIFTYPFVELFNIFFDIWPLHANLAITFVAGVALTFRRYPYDDIYILRFVYACPLPSDSVTFVRDGRPSHRLRDLYALPSRCALRCSSFATLAAFVYVSVFCLLFAYLFTLHLLCRPIAVARCLTHSPPPTAGAVLPPYHRHLPHVTIQLVV